MSEKALQWWQQLQQQLQLAEMWYQLLALIACALLAVLINRMLGSRLADSGGQGLKHVALRSSHRILLPFSMAALLAGSDQIFRLYQLPNQLLQFFI
ncbi:hypothetical protein, partial [Shewanella sp. CG12_big_fil_rev_8_21_14_0_65_47_15]|uniref:hypothetical protein n=1 Tax=Shewanella sp. CG12_big_fil_rev_8_21_14_0_65_47_15 TaxID=1975537 RepID=UPI000CB26E2A